MTNWTVISKIVQFSQRFQEVLSQTLFRIGSRPGRSGRRRRLMGDGCRFLGTNDKRSNEEGRKAGLPAVLHALFDPCNGLQSFFVEEGG